MAEQAQPHHQAAVQHLAYLQQAQRQSPTVGDHSHWVATAEARLEAHLSQHQRQALVAVQDLEHQRLKSLPGSGANQHL